MFASTTCPACRHKYAIPEGSMGKRQICPNCQSPFVAGKSVPEANGGAKSPPSTSPPAPPPGPVGINKTMLGETEPPVHYNCPRCKAPLESPAIEAGTKKPCPKCGQRLQIPAPPPPPAVPGLNKTMLAPEATSSAPTAFHAPPAAPSAPSAGAAEPTRAAQPFGGRGLMLAAAAFGGVLVLVLLTCILSAMLRNSGRDDQALANAQKELEKLRAEIQQRKADVDRQKQFEADQQKKWDAIMAELRLGQEKLKLERELEAKALAAMNDKRARDEAEAAAKAKRDAEERELDRRKQEAEKLNQTLAQIKAESEANRRALEAANQKAAVIVSQPPPVYYPPWNWRYYWGW